MREKKWDAQDWTDVMLGSVFPIVFLGLMIALIVDVANG
jgi:hypothetical protein